VFTDKLNRVHLLTGASILWSLTSIVTGSTFSFPTLVLMRVMFGIFSSVVNPASLSLIRDMFPEEKHSTANAIFSTNVYFGMAASSLSGLLIKTNGWRFDYTVAGLLGMAAGGIGYFALLQPKRGAFDKLECNIEGNEELRDVTLREELTLMKEQFKDAFRELKSNKTV
jgi:MFS family permease